MRQEGSLAQPLGPDSACGRKDGGGGLFGREPSIPAGLVQGGEGSFIISPRPGGKGKRKTVLLLRSCFLLNLPLFLCSFIIVQSLLLTTIFVAHRNVGGPHLGRNTAAGIANMCLALAQKCSQAGGVLPCTLPPTQIGKRSWCAENWLGPD